MGHSIGEWVAACLAGVFSLEDALHLVSLRGRWMEEMEPGDMLAVALSEAEAERRLRDRDDLELAAVNGPRACVISGPSKRIDALLEELEGDGVEGHRLHTSHAFHSELMEPMLERFEAAIAKVERHDPEIPFVSNVSGTWITALEARDPAYWCRHTRHTVRFADGLATLLEEPGRRLLELGPGRQLSTLARQHEARDHAALIQTTLPRPQDRGKDLETLMVAVGRFWEAGGEIDWRALHGPGRRRRSLPTYPFERRPYLMGTALGGAASSAPEARAKATLPSPPFEPDGTGSRPLGPQLTGVQSTIAEVWRDMLGVESLRPSDDFFDLGGSSLMAIKLSQRLEQVLEVELPSSFLLETSTIAGIAGEVERLQKGAGPRESTCLVRLKDGASHEAPLFLVHQVGGQAFTFRALARNLGGSAPVYGIRSRGLEEGETPLKRVEEMADHYLSLIRSVQPNGPYRLGGASMGGMVALEMAQRLRRVSAGVESLVIMDTPCLDQMPEREDEALAVAAIYRGHGGLDLEVEALRALGSLDERLAFASEKSEEADGGLDPSQARRLVEVLLANTEALYSYQPQAYDGRITLLRAAQRRDGDPPRPELAWIQLATGGLDFIETPGNHVTMHEPPHVQAMAAHLRRALALGLEDFVSSATA